MSTIAGQPTVPTAQPTIVFGSDGSISGSTGCNTYSGHLHGLRQQAHRRPAGDDQEGLHRRGGRRPGVGVHGGARQRHELRRRLRRQPDPEGRCGDRREARRGRQLIERSRVGLDHGRRSEDRMRIAHVRERNAPAGTPWRLAAARRRRAGDTGRGWTSRRRAACRRPTRGAPTTRAVSSAGHHAGRGAGRRTAGRGAGRLVDGVAANDSATTVSWGPTCLRPADSPAAVVPRLLRLRAARRDDVGAPRGEIPEAWYRLPIFFFATPRRFAGRTIRSGRRGVASWTTSSRSAALVDTPAYDLVAGSAEEAIGGYRS